MKYKLNIVRKVGLKFFDSTLPIPAEPVKKEVEVFDGIEMSEVRIAKSTGRGVNFDIPEKKSKSAPKVTKVRRIV